jgi:anti-anti-sigma factor
VLPEFSLTVRKLPHFDAYVVGLTGELDTASANLLTDALADVAASSVVVDLSGLTFMDCCGIGALVVARNTIRASEPASQRASEPGQLVVIGPSGIGRKALQLVGLSEWIIEALPGPDASSGIESALADRPRAGSSR